MKSTSTRNLIAAALATVLTLTTARAADITPAEVRAIAKEAYIYGFPLVDNYRIQSGYFVDSKDPEYDSDGKKLDGANRYAVRFAPGQLPPVNAFWSLTMYELPKSLLVANPINRYLINSPMLPALKKDADGGVTLLVQNESPGKDKGANWLPAPEGPFIMYMRLYWPKEEATEGKWTAPKLTQAK